MINNRVILRHNRATADLTEYLLNEAKLYLEPDKLIPTVRIDALVATPLATLPLRITIYEWEHSNDEEVQMLVSWKVEQIDTNGQLHCIGSGQLEHSTMSAMQAVMSCGHLAGDLIKFYYKGGK